MKVHAVTGAFGYTGKYIAQRLLNKGLSVKTFTNSWQRKNEFGDRIEVSPFYFDKPEKLAEALDGVSVLYNTYWVRFNHHTFKHSEAIENSIKLFQAAKKAGVGRIVHTSILKPDKNSPLEYYSGKGILEEELAATGISYSILRPGVIFGKEDILINNIAWMIRKFPVFGMFGNGNYKLQPIYVEDFADLAVEQGLKTSNAVIDATGPEIFTYKELVKTISEIISGKEITVFPLPDLVGFWISKLVGLFKGDNLVTYQEIKGLKADLLYSDAQPAGKTKLTDWLKQNKDTVGKDYANELKRRLDRTIPYK